MEHPFFSPDACGPGAGQILDAIRPDLPDEAFDQLALGLLRQQAIHVPPYRRLLSGLGLDASRLSHWTEFPALPASAFRDAPVCGFDPVRATHVFETSGTTATTTGRHYLASPLFYQTSLRTAFKAFMPPLDAHQWVLLIPPPALRPHSSLSFMLGHLAPPNALWCVDGNYQIDEERFRLALRSSVQPIALFGTSFALARAADSAPVPCPPGSIIFDTGGMKGRHRELNRHDFLHLLRHAFAIPPDHIWNEYGMTEWSSQGYARMDEGLHRFPAWMRIRVVDPASGRDCPPGQPGLVCACDLANVGSVAAIATRDAAQWELTDRGPALRLLGRWSNAEPRGCSLPYE